MHENLKQIMMRSKNFHESDFLDNVLGNRRDDVIKGHVPVVLYGAGSAGKDILPVFQLHGVFPKCFCDSNPSLTNTMYFGLPVISRDQLIHDKECVIFITSAKYGDQIRRELMDEGIEETRIITINIPEMSFYSQFYQLHATLGDVDAKMDLIGRVYDLLADQFSKDLYLEKIALFYRGADYRSYINFLHEYSDFEKNSIVDDPEHYENYYYCNNPLFQFGAQEVVVNGGAFEGGFVLEFVRFCEKHNLPYGHIHSFEPDTTNFDKLQINTRNILNISNYCLGLWSHATELQFISSDQIEAPSARIVPREGDIEVISPRAGNVIVKTTSLDDVLADQRVTFIKMDVEGAEIEAINGSKRILQELQPKLAISVYHKMSDLFEIPWLIHTINPQYKLFLRHLSNTFMETVLFAVV